jgi:energy-coupling factor transporter ATP-binding protein EcfA2
MIRSVEFRNFKSLREVKLDLERFTVLVGPNASGKTTILQGLDILTRLYGQEPQDLFRGDLDPFLLYTRGAAGPIELLLEQGDSALKFTGTPKGGSPATGSPHQPSNGQGRPWEFGRVGRMGPAEAQGDPSVWVTPHALKGPTAAFLRLDPKRLSDPSYSPGESPQIEPDGTGLASALAYTALNQPDTFAALKETLRGLFPYVRGVRFERVRVLRATEEPTKTDHGWVPVTAPRTYWGESIVFDMEGAPGIPAAHASDGTVLVLGLLAAIMGADRRQLVLLDDLDHGLHPKAQRDLVGLLRKLLDEMPDLQIVATTHSPYLLDQMRPEEVRLTTRRPDGSVACGRLDEHPDFERWREAMTPGEFWSMVGEKWVAERRAQEVGA